MKKYLAIAAILSVNSFCIDYVFWKIPSIPFWCAIAFPWLLTVGIVVACAEDDQRREDKVFRETAEEEVRTEISRPRVLKSDASPFYNKTVH